MVNLKNRNEIKDYRKGIRKIERNKHRFLKNLFNKKFIGKLGISFASVFKLPLILPSSPLFFKKTFNFREFGDMFRRCIF